MNFLPFLILFSFSVFSSEPASDFFSLCQTTLKENHNALPLCQKIQDKFFIQNKTKDISLVTPESLGAKTQPIDDKIQFYIFNDPNFMSGIAYCYFVFRNWISPSEISPDTLSMNATGFSILNEDLNKYQEWLLKKPEGLKCKQKVEKESEVTVANLENYLKGRLALIGLNPYAALHSPDVSYESVMNEMKLTVNHERIHAYHVACPDFDKWSTSEWEKLPSKEKNSYIKKYPSYTWTIPQIAGREFIAFKFEDRPEKVLDYIKKCKF
jgi:hypothetical protein